MANRPLKREGQGREGASARDPVAEARQPASQARGHPQPFLRQTLLTLVGSQVQ